MCDCDDYPPEFFHAFVRKARKAHRCCECHRPISTGESYEEHSGKWDGRVETFRWCSHCAAAVDVMEYLLSDFRFRYGEVWRSVVESVDYERKSTIISALRLCVGARRRWAKRRGPDKGELMPLPGVSAPAAEARRMVSEGRR